MKGLKVKCEIEGLNQDRFIESCKKRDICLYDVKKVSRKSMYITVNFNQSKNFFAIAKELCYNIKKVKYTGKVLPLFQLLKNAGLLIGAVLLAVITALCNDLVFDIDVSGTGSIYEKEVLAYLGGRGIGVYSRFSSFDVSALEDEILKDNSHLTFVSCVKKGNTLSVYTVLKTDSVETLEGDVKSLVSDVDGVVESLKVYRGTALVEEGDSVCVGDVLVDGYVDIKEQRLQINVLACVTLRVKSTFVYFSEKDGEEEKAILLAEENLDGKEIIGSSVSVGLKTGNGVEQYEYTVETEYRCVYFAG